MQGSPAAAFIASRTRVFEDVVFIEVQHGERLDEDDIERLQDGDGRMA